MVVECLQSGNEWESSGMLTGKNQTGMTATNEHEPFEGDERLDQLHRVLLMMLKDFAQLCEREGLAWIGSYGTAIGALRHSGFIPWDDDLDIVMPRADLTRLVEVVSRDTNRKYLIIDAQLCPTYPLATTRFMLKGTEFRDSALATMDFPSGIFLDLFPLDALSDDERAFRRQAWRTWLFNKLAIAKYTKDPYIAAGGLQASILRMGSSVARGLLNAPGLRAIDLNGHALKWTTRYLGQNTRRVGYLCDTDRFTCMYAHEDLFPVRWVPFEDTTIPIANHAEKLLEEYYGDYMTPPPADKRREHYPDILDFGPYADV